MQAKNKRSRTAQMSIQLLLSLIGAVSLRSPCFADRMDPSLIPPDVTLTTGSSGAAAAAAHSSGPTPGLGASTTPAAGTSAAASTPAATATPKPGQMLPPGAIPSPPPPANRLWQHRRTSAGKQSLQLFNVPDTAFHWSSSHSRHFS